LKRNFLLSILAVVPAVLMPLAATCQVTPAASPATTERAEPSYKYEVYGGFGYTSLNQVNGSRYGLMGAEASVTRYLGKYFGISGNGAFYSHPVATGNPGSPTVDTVLFGPVLRAPLFARTSAFVRVLIGGEHTGGESQTPNISFAGGVGGGMDYDLNKHFSIRASGDNVASSFTVISPVKGDSPHETWSSRASIGVVYKF